MGPETPQTVGNPGGTPESAASGPDSNESTSNAPAQKLSFGDQIREKASVQLSGQKDRAVQGLSSLVQAARETGKQLRDNEQGSIASYVEGAADQIERLSEGIGSKDFSEVIDDVERFAHRQPALFLGLSFGAGLLAARFVKSSRPRPAMRSGGNRYAAGTSVGGGPGYGRSTPSQAYAGAYGNAPYNRPTGDASRPHFGGPGGTSAAAPSQRPVGSGTYGSIGEPPTARREDVGPAAANRGRLDKTDFDPAGDGSSAER